MLFDGVGVRLSSSFGPIGIRTPIRPWTYTEYYTKEMGSDLKRVFLFFEKPVEPDRLSNFKIITSDVERYFAVKAPSGIFRRTVNIDPGYLTLSKVVLASTKDYSHRIYIGKGIYAEVTLYYQDKSYWPFPYTYPDYRSEEYIEMFNRVRDRYFSSQALACGYCLCSKKRIGRKRQKEA